MFGAHLSIAGGLVNALHRARELRMDCVQVFTKNQRQWKTPPLRDEDRDAWLAQLQRMKWRSSDRRGRTIAHNSYLINLASPDSSMHRRSIDLQREEMLRAEALDIPFLVAHPGAHLGEAPPPGTPHQLGRPPTRDELAGLKRIAKALDQLHRDLPGLAVITCLEATAGSGSNLGYDFTHLAMLREMVRSPGRIGFCLDTCHATAAGYDMSTPQHAAETLEKFNAGCGFDSLHVLHMNDSAASVGSRRDRHAHIGEGACGRACFAAIVNHPRLAGVPKVLETPKEETPRGTHYDRINLRRLRRLRAHNGRAAGKCR